jgi:hypothetical protein
VNPTDPAALIPGARERRIAQSGADPSAPAAVPATIASPASAPAGNARRLEYEREGGGSPAERQGQSQKTLTARLRRWLFGGK